MDRPVIYTVGHSTHPLDYFLELLRTYEINCLIDVRSVAASFHNPQYKKETLSNFLYHSGVTYMHFAEEFGARQAAPELLDDEGWVDFEKVRQTQNFRKGIERLHEGIHKGFIIALMCAESDPFNCHRFLLISVALEQNGFNVLHILKDKTIKTNAQLESQLLEKYANKLPRSDMFANVTVDDRLKAAYRLRNKELASAQSAKQQKTAEKGKGSIKIK